MTPLFKRATAVLVGIASIFLTHSAVADDVSIRSYDNAELFKNYALSQCIARAYGLKEVRADGLAVADAYVQFGEVNDVDAYGEAVALAGKWLSKHYPSKNGQPLQLMKCIDLLHSAELQALTNRYVPN